MKKAIFLDMDETLCDTKKADRKTQEWIKDILIPEYKIKDCENWAESYFLGIYKELVHDNSNLKNAINNTELYREALIEHLFNEQNVFLNKAEYKKIQKSIDQKRMYFFDFFPGVISLLKELRKKHKLIIITNGPAFSQQPKLEKTKLFKYVDHIIIGGNEPEEKPSPNIFKKALSLANVKVSEAIHVGDSLITDIQGASNLGITSVWINQNKTSAYQQKGCADFIIPKVTDLPKILKLLVENHD